VTEPRQTVGSPISVPGRLSVRKAWTNTGLVGEIGSPEAADLWTVRSAIAGALRGGDRMEERGRIPG